jgi:hypothetical protein
VAIPVEMSRHLDGWIGTFPSPWWIYLRLRARGHLAPGVSGARVREIVRAAIRDTARERRVDVPARAPDLGAAWNTRVVSPLLEEELLSPAGEAMARWMPW